MTSYSILYTIAVLAAFFVVSRLLKKEGLYTSEILRITFLCGIFMISGAKVLKIFYFIALNFRYILKNPSYILHNFFHIGTMLFGALAGFFFFFYIYVRPRYHERTYLLLDVNVIGVALGQSIGRIGCFLAGCCYGRPTSLPWGVKFSHLGSSVHPFYDTPIHPTQIYESLLDFLNFLVLYSIYRKKKFEGQVSAFYLMNYGVIRFLMEYLRKDVHYLLKGSQLFLSLTLFQAVSLVLFLSGMYVYRIRRTQSV